MKRLYVAENNFRTTSYCIPRHDVQPRIVLLRMKIITPTIFPSSSSAKENEIYM
jgi:hypothetical protein